MSSSFPASFLYEWPMSDAENAQWREKHPQTYPPNIHQPSQRLCLHLWVSLLSCIFQDDYQIANFSMFLFYLTFCIPEILSTVS